MLFLILLILFLVMGSISASDDASDSVSLETNDAIDDEVVAESSSNDIVGDLEENNLENNNDDNIVSDDSSLASDAEGSISDVNSLASTESSVDESSLNDGKLSSSNEIILSNSSSGGIDSSSSDDSKNLEGTNSAASATVKYPSKVYYTQGKITFQVKVGQFFKYGGNEYLNPLYGSNILLKVYSGTTYNTFSRTIDLNNNGVFNFQLPSLSLGSHKIEIFVDNIKKVDSSFKVVKSSTKVLAPTKSVKHKKKAYFYIRVFDSSGIPAKKIILKVKVYTGKKYKTYTLKTTTTGLAKLQTRKLALGKHKVVIITTNKKYNIKKTSYIKVLKKVASKAQTLKVSAPTKTVKYKQSSYFNITVLNPYNYPVKKLYIKVKVFTGKKSKTYTIKTNTKGIAKLQTKALTTGTHKISISTKNKKYKISKSSKIIVNKTIYSDYMDLTKLSSVYYYPDGDNFKAKLSWHSKKGSEYVILRKLNSDYEIIAKVKADSTEDHYINKLSKNTLYTYTVGKVLKSNGVNVIGPYDYEGLKLIDRPEVSVDFQNLKAVIQWTKVEDATKYRIFRKMGRSDDYSVIHVADADDSYQIHTDVYYLSVNELKPILNGGVFADPSFNNLFYTVRGCYIKSFNGTPKSSSGLYYPDGDFNLEAPSIVSISSKSISWGKVPTADGYFVFKRNSLSDSWNLIGSTEQKSSTCISLALNGLDKDAYYTVQAYAKKNGKMIYSQFDEGFTLQNYGKYDDYSILYFGDSITYGSPYKSEASRHIFSIPNRVAQLTGCTFYNPSIPGSTYHDLGLNPDGTNVEQSNYYRYRICREVVDQIAEGELPANWQSLDTAYNSAGEKNTRLDDYNVVVLAAGTNDYLDNSTLGDLDSDDVSEFHGALNHIMEQILNASLERIQRGEDAIKVVFVDLYYSDRTYNEKERNNRDVTPNRIGLTLMDYQRALNETLQKWELLTKDSEDPTKSNLTFYQFDTRSYDIVNQENCPYTASDNLHFTKFTYGQYGNAFAQFLVDEVFKENGEPDTGD